MQGLKSSKIGEISFNWKWGKTKNPLIALALATTSWFGASSALATPPPGYYLVWSDEFNGNSLDMTKWNYYDSISPTAVSVTNGCLNITTYTTNGASYSGIIYTEGRFRSFYGYYESSIEFNDLNAMWSDFWLQSPSNGQYLGDPSASGAEVDMVEHRYVDVSNTNVISGSVQETVHWDGYGGTEQTVSPVQVGTGLDVGFHTYGLLWTPDAYTCSIDDDPTFYTVQGHSDRSEIIFFSSQVQSPSWAGSTPPGGYGDLNTSTCKMKADYVRYYAAPTMAFWTGTSSSDWSDSANWLSNMTVTADTDVVFDYLSTSNFNVILTQDTTVHTLTIQETPPMTFSGNPLTVTIGIDLVSALNDATISAPLIANVDQSWRAGAGRQLTVSGLFSGAGNLTLAGYGTIAFTGTNLNTGSMTVGGKSTLLAGCTINNPIFVTGGTLAETATGTFNGPVQVSGGTVSANVGVPLIISNSLALLPGGSAVFGINATAETNGQIVGLTSVTYGGVLVLNDTAGPFAPGQAFKLFDATNYSGNFASISPTIPGYQLVWDTSTLTNDGVLRVASSVAMASTNIFESRSGTSTAGANNPAFSFSGFSASISSAKSTAPGLTSASCRFANTFSNVPPPAFSVTPTLLVGPTYEVSVTWGKIAGNFAEVPDFNVAPTVTGVSASTLPSLSSVYSGGPSNNINNVWLPVGTITPNTPNPTLTFTYAGGFTSGRWYIDAVRFISVLPSPDSISGGIQGTNLVLNWNGNFTLQSSTNVAGPYTDIPGPVVVGPYTNAINSGQMFFRLRQ